MKRMIIIQMLFIFTAQFCLAGQLAGISSDTLLVGLVVNHKNKAIKNVPITAKNKDGVFKTNRKGIFIIENISLYDSLTMIIPKNKLYMIPVSGMPFLKVTIREKGFTANPARDEIEDIGYAVVRKTRSTSANVVISGDELRQAGSNILSALTGKVSGINVYYNENGKPYLYFRGGTSIVMDNLPLYIVDGMTVEDLDYVNINDVEQVTVMKEAPMYGSRGANGAIVVKTK